MTDTAMAALQTATGVITSAIKTTASVTRIAEVNNLIGLVPGSVMLLGHCLAIAGLSRQSGNSHLLSYVMGFLLAFGGGIAASIFLGTPTDNPLFENNQTVIYWTLAWWIVNYQPFQAVTRVLELAPLGIACRAILQIRRASIIAVFVDAAAKAFPGVVAPAVIAGTLAASGGKMFTESIASFSGLRSGFEIATPSFVLRSALVGSAVYYATVHYLHALTSAEGLAIITLALLTHTLSDDLLGSAYDYTVPVIRVFSTVTLIGAPKKAARGRSSRPAAPTTPRSGSKARTPSRRRRSD